MLRLYEQSAVLEEGRTVYPSVFFHAGEIEPDPTTEDFFRVGELLGALRLPTCVVQEGGYHTPDIGLNVRALLEGLREGQSPSGR